MLSSSSTPSSLEQIQKRLLRSSATSWRNVGSTEWSETPVICVVTGIAARNGPITLKNRPTVFIPKGRMVRASSRSSFG